MAKKFEAESVDETTGDVETSELLLKRLCALEAEIGRCDGVVASLQDGLKQAKAERDTAIAGLREAVRDQSTLLLFKDLEIG